MKDLIVLNKKHPSFMDETSHSWEFIRSQSDRARSQDVSAIEAAHTHVWHQDG